MLEELSNKYRLTIEEIENWAYELGLQLIEKALEGDVEILCANGEQFSIPSPENLK